MSQTWVENDEAADGTTVKQGMINLEDKLDTVRSQFSGTAFPTDADRAVGQLCWRTDSGLSTGVGLYLLTSLSPDTWIFLMGTTGITTFAASLLDDADASTMRTTLGLGSVATVASGTADAEIQVNSQNNTKFCARADNLSNLASASLARGNLNLGSLATLDSIGTSGLGANAVTRAKLAVIEQSLEGQVKAGAYTAQAMEHVTCTVAAASSWTLELPTSPTAGERVSVYAKSIEPGEVLTIDGTSKNILGGITTSLKLHVTGDSCDLLYNGTEWVPLGGANLAPHTGQISASGFTQSGTTLQTIPFDTNDFSNAGIADHTSDRITIKRAGLYQVSGQLLFGSTGPFYMCLQIRLNGSQLQEEMVSNIYDYEPSTYRSQSQLVTFVDLAVDDYLEMFQEQQVAADPPSFARLTAIEQR